MAFSIDFYKTVPRTVKMKSNVAARRSVGEFRVVKLDHRRRFWLAAHIVQSFWWSNLIKRLSDLSAEKHFDKDKLDHGLLALLKTDKTGLSRNSYTFASLYHQYESNKLLKKESKYISQRVKCQIRNKFCQANVYLWRGPMPSEHLYCRH